MHLLVDVTKLEDFKFSIAMLYPEWGDYPVLLFCVGVVFESLLCCSGLLNVVKDFDTAEASLSLCLASSAHVNFS